MIISPEILEKMEDLSITFLSPSWPAYCSMNPREIFSKKKEEQIKKFKGDVVLLGAAALLVMACNSKWL